MFAFIVIDGRAPSHENIFHNISDNISEIAQIGGETCVGKVWQCVEDMLLRMWMGTSSKIPTGRALWLMVTKTSEINESNHKRHEYSHPHAGRQ